MNKTLPTFYLFLIIILEGYVVLSSELLAIRQSIPFVGSGTDTVSIIIAAVLMPLAFGYQTGGKFKPGFNKNGKYQTIRGKLIQNLLISLIILIVGLSYYILTHFFKALMELDISNRLIKTTLYSGIFLVIPVYLLGQTIPLVSNYFSKEKLAKVTGKILFFSTMGSFLGAVFSTLVLMSTIGVHHTVALNFIILTALIVILSKKKLSQCNILLIIITACAVYLNSGTVMKKMDIIENNKYNTITFKEVDRFGDIERHLQLNNNASSMLSESGKKHAYIEYIEEIAIFPLWNEDIPPKDILVIGAGAFTLGLEDEINNYDYLDLDKSLLKISEERILKRPIGDNKTFHAIPARAFLSDTEKNYDLIVVDAFLGNLTIPEHLVTQNFFNQVKSKLNPEGAVIANFVISATFDDPFSQNLDNTLRSVFPNMTRLILNEYDVWNTQNKNTSNVIYVYRNHLDAKSTIYTDNKNTVFFDRR